MTTTTAAELLRAHEIAARLRVSVRGARDLLAEAEARGEIVRLLLSPRRVRWDARAIDRWIDARVNQAQQEAARRARLLAPPDPEPELPSPQSRRRRARTPPPPQPAVPQDES